MKNRRKKLRLNCSTGKILVSKVEDSLDRKLISLKGCIVHKNDTRKQNVSKSKQKKISWKYSCESRLRGRERKPVEN